MSASVIPPEPVLVAALGPWLWGAVGELMLTSAIVTMVRPAFGTMGPIHQYSGLKHGLGRTIFDETAPWRFPQLISMPVATPRLYDPSRLLDIHAMTFGTQG